MVTRKHVVLIARCLLACAGVLAGMAGRLGAATYVVDQAAPGTADTNPGTEEKPFRTVQHAANTVKPGDTVHVLAGKYDERIKVKVGGRDGQRVAFVAMPRRSAMVGGFDLEASYVRVEGGAVGREPLRDSGQFCP
jgi:hypothetical protein